MSTNSPTMDALARTEVFVRQTFAANPHHSFGDGTVMFEHSVRVKELALRLAQEVGADPLLVGLGGLLHDIGKAYPADEETLHQKHEELGVLVAAPLLGSLELPAPTLLQLRSLIAHTSASLEMQVMEDADALAFFLDKRLYMLFLAWATNTNHHAAIEKKTHKFEKLHFPLSRQLGSAAFGQMWTDWKAYLTEHHLEAFLPLVQG